jgi:hypothetical protein
MDLILAGKKLAQKTSRKGKKGTAVGHRNNSSMSCHNNPQSIPNKSVDKVKRR